MYGKDNGAQHDIEVPGGEGEAPLNTQEVQPRAGQKNTEPDDRGDPLFQKQAEDGHQHHIHGGDKTGFAGGGVRDADLLQICRNGQAQTAGDTAPEKFTFWLGGKAAAALSLMADAVMQDQQKDGCNFSY